MHSRYTFAQNSVTFEGLPSIASPGKLRRPPHASTAMRIATWNVNSIKQRLDNLVAWLTERQPDIVCLQETKCVDDAFPREPLEALGYNVAIHGQKTFNGVAVLSKLPFDEVTPRLPGDDGDDHARFLEAVVSTKAGALRIASIYLPNGNPPAQRQIYLQDQLDGAAYSLRARRLKLEEPLVLAGDYNVIPTELDARNPAAWLGDALFLPRDAPEFRALCNLGLTDAVRATSDAPGLTRSGTIRRAPGRRTMAFASTTCCCRRRRPTG